MKFPLFIDLKNKPVLVVGNGRIGGRRAEILKSFGADVHIKDTDFSYEDINGKFLVLACTNDRTTNKHISEICRQKNIFVSVADSAEESTFFFPALCQSEDICVGLVSSGDKHTLVKETAQKIRSIL